MKIFLCEELRALHHNKRNWFPSYLDHYSNSSIREINLYNVTNVCKIHPTKSQVIGKKGCKYCLFCPYISSVMPFFIYRAVGMTFSGQKISVILFGGPPLQWMEDSGCTENWRGEMREICLLAILSEPSEQIIID